ncbi:hypothetical protein HN007_06840 [Candidatus Bathyarchaeota archaeon A05DMB-3]|jgi:hypothetical protein|nr:hypothetical protein [Candidatus Bathyarchaeota archaeon A05DMB-3]
MTAMEIVINKKKLVVQDDTLKIVNGSVEEKYDLSKLANVGVKRKFSKPLLLLAIIFAVIGIVNADNPFYIILAVLMFLSAIVLREESLILAFENKTLVLDVLDRKKSNELLKHFEKCLKKKQ